MSLVPRAQGGFYYDFLFLEDEILRVKIVSQSSAGILTAAVFVLLWFVIGLGGFVGGAIGALVVTLIARRVAISRRKKLSALSLDELKKREKILTHIPWSEVTSVELKGTNLTIRTNKKKLKTKIQLSDVDKIKTFVGSKVGGKLTIEQ